MKKTTLLLAGTSLALGATSAFAGSHTGSITAVKTALQQEFNSNDNLVHTFDVNENAPTYVEGYVVSSDATGNFYKKLIIQDKSESPTAGIEIVLNKTSLSETYPST